jgi:hypothetical protein
MAARLLRNIQLPRTSNSILEYAMNDDQKDRNYWPRPGGRRVRKGG